MLLTILQLTIQEMIMIIKQNTNHKPKISFKLLTEKKDDIYQLLYNFFNLR